MPATTMTALEAAAAVKAQSEEKKNAGMKLKETPLFKGTDTLAISDLNWYTTADNIVEVAGKAGVELRRKDVVFAEHKVNGKTKGSVIISCHKEDAASRLAHWFHNNDFQGKRINPSFVNSAAGHPFKPSGGVSAGPRPVLNTQILLAHGPTNAHGGVNFNRVKPARLAQQVQAQAAVQALGMGWPTSLYKSKAYLNHHNHMGDDGLGQSGWNKYGLHPYAHPFVPLGMGAEYSQ